MTARDVESRLGNWQDTVYPSRNSNAAYRKYEYGEALKSYRTFMAAKILGVYFFHREDENYTRTTCRHLREWCGMTLKDIRAYCKQHPNRVFC